MTTTTTTTTTLTMSNGLRFLVQLHDLGHDNGFGDTHHVQVTRIMPGESEGAHTYGKYHKSLQAATADQVDQATKLQAAATKCGLSVQLA